MAGRYGISVTYVFWYDMSALDIMLTYTHGTLRVTYVLANVMSGVTRSFSNRVTGRSVAMTKGRDDEF